MPTDLTAGDPAATTTSTTAPTAARDRGAAAVDADDLLPVRSRISWGAILAGAVLALALYFLLTLLGAAVGLSVAGDAGASELGIGAGIFAIVVTAACLFAGGYAASQFTAGENRAEAAVYGLLVWAVVFGMLLWLMASGVRAGFNAMVGVATAGGAAVGAAADAVPTGALTSGNISAADAEDLARRAGFDQAQIDGLKESARTRAAELKRDAANTDLSAEADRRVSDAAERAGDAASTAAWLSFAGTLLSMLAAVGGGYLGGGPQLRLLAGRPARPGAA